MASRQMQKPFFTCIEYKNMWFLIMDSPNTDNVDNFVKDCIEQNVTDVVRVCDPRYPKEPFEKAGINFHDWEFDDGSPPPAHILRNWFSLLNDRFNNQRTSPTSNDNTTGSPISRLQNGADDASARNNSRIIRSCGKPVAVHCLAGYGRAPVLVAVALMELGMTGTDAVEFIRSRRKGAFNDRQLHYITHYRSNNRLRPSRKCRIL